MSSSDVDDAKQRWQNDNDVLKTHTECCCTYNVYLRKSFPIVSQSSSTIESGCGCIVAGENQAGGGGAGGTRLTDTDVGEKIACNNRKKCE